MHEFVNKERLVAQKQRAKEGVTHAELGVLSLHDAEASAAKILHPTKAVGQPAELQQVADSEILTRDFVAEGDVALHIGMLIIDFEGLVVAVAQKAGKYVKSVGAWRGSTVDISPQALQGRRADHFLGFEKDLLAELVEILGRVIVLARNFFYALDEYFFFHIKAVLLFRKLVFYSAPWSFMRRLAIPQTDGAIQKYKYCPK